MCGGCLSLSCAAPQLLHPLNLTDASGSSSLSPWQKYAHVRQSQRGSKPYYTSVLWWCGVVLMGIGELGNFAAYGFAPASLIAPLGCVSVIGTCDLFFPPHTLSMHEGKRKGCFLREQREALSCEICSFSSDLVINRRLDAKHLQYMLKEFYLSLWNLKKCEMTDKEYSLRCIRFVGDGDGTNSTLILLVSKDQVQITWHGNKLY